jgi:flagellar biosynthesis/type III secretory pathway protein FliH
MRIMSTSDEQKAIEQVREQAVEIARLKAELRAAQNKARLSEEWEKSLHKQNEQLEAELQAFNRGVEAGEIGADQNYWRGFDAGYAKARAELQAAQEQREKAARVELGRHLCFTSHAAQRDFWTRVEDRAAQRTEEGDNG